MSIYDQNDPVRQAIRLRVAERMAPKDPAEVAAIDDVRAQMLIDRIKTYDTAIENLDRRWASKAEDILSRNNNRTSCTEYTTALKAYQDEHTSWTKCKRTAQQKLESLG